MTDRLDELLEQEPEGEELLWWRDGALRPVTTQEQTLRQTSPEQALQPNAVMHSGGTEKPGRAAGAEPVWQQQDRMQTVREVELARRAARRAMGIAAGSERVRQRELGPAQESAVRTMAALKHSPAAGQQGLTAQIDTQFRRDARRYDGRLGLL